MNRAHLYVIEKGATFVAFSLDTRVQVQRKMETLEKSHLVCSLFFFNIQIFLIKIGKFQAVKEHRDD